MGELVTMLIGGLAGALVILLQCFMGYLRARRNERERRNEVDRVIKASRSADRISDSRSAIAFMQSKGAVRGNLSGAATVPSQRIGE